MYMFRTKYTVLLLSILALAGIFACGRVNDTVSVVSDITADEPAVPAPPIAEELPSAVKILPKTDCVYHGAFLGDDAITAVDIDAFESVSGKKLDIVLKFLAFNCMGTTGGFPLAEANIVSANGSVLFIKLEPWSWEGADDDSFSLNKIIAGDFDGRIASFAQDAASFGEPLFISFGHEMNASWYPWGGSPELYKQAFKHVHDLMGLYATNITWVWNPNISEGPISAYYPGDDYVDWVAADGYNTEDYGVSWKSAEQLFNPMMGDLESFGKPVMIGEMACDANTENEEAVEKPDWLYLAVEWMAGKKKSGSSDNLIKAFVYFNFDKTEDGEPKKWAISRSEAKAQYKQAISDNSSYFKGIDL